MSCYKLFIHCKTLASEIKTQNTMLDTHVFAHHPQNTEVFYGCTSQSFYQYNYIIQGEPHCHDLHQCSESEDYIMGQCYTSDGSYILTVMRAANETIVYRLSAKERDTKWMMWNVGKYYSSILCYPNNRMLFLLDCKNKIECWDYSKSEHIHTIEIANQEDIPSIGYMEKRLAVSHDGRTLFVALKDKCCMIELPFEALCDQQIKENLFVIMSLLKRYEKDDVALIGDAIYAIILKLIMLYKYLP